MTTHPSLSTSELVLPLIAIRLAAMVAVCAVVLAAPAHPLPAGTACSTVGTGSMQVPEVGDDNEESIRDMLRHD